MIERVIDSMISNEIQDISVGIGWEGEKIKNHLESQYPDGNVLCIDVPDYRVGALRTLVTTSAGIEDQLLICPVDYVFDESIVKQLLLSIDALGSFDLAIATDERTSSSHGTPLDADSDNRIRKIGDGPLRSAMMLTAPPSFLELCRNQLTSGCTTVLEVLKHMIAMEMNVVSCPITGYWSDVDSLSDLLKINTDLLQAYQPSPTQLYLPPNDELEIGESFTLDSGIELEAGSHLKGPLLFDGSIKVHQDTIIGPNVCISGKARIENGCSITESVIFGDTHIGIGSHVTQMIVHDSLKYPV